MGRPPFDSRRPPMVLGGDLSVIVAVGMELHEHQATVEAVGASSASARLVRALWRQAKPIASASSAGPSTPSPSSPSCARPATGADSASRGGYEPGRDRALSARPRVPPTACTTAAGRTLLREVSEFGRAPGHRAAARRLSGADSRQLTLRARPRVGPAERAMRRCDPAPQTAHLLAARVARWKGPGARAVWLGPRRGWSAPIRPFSAASARGSSTFVVHANGVCSRSARDDR